MSISRNFIQELLARADVVEIIGRHVQLKKTGANFSGLCPFHSEKSPSFTVSPVKQFYHCFGCGKSGDAIGFLMDHTGASFRETVQDLAQQYGLQVPEDERSPAERERAAQDHEKRHTLTGVLERAGEAYRKHLKSTPRAIDYLKERGLSGQIARDFGLGYAPEGWRTLASVFADYADPLLDESGLVIASDDGEGKRYDRFRDRIMFPIRNVKGEVIGFGGRVLAQREGAPPAAAGPKYLNSPETPVFHKGQELYGLFEARAALREHGYALVTEGYMDVVALAQLGFANAVATLGTACTPEHVHKLFRFTDHVVFSFDGDAAGRRAARKALEAALPLATDLRDVRFLFLPAEHDPDSFIRSEGAEAFAQAVKNAVPLSRFLLEAAEQDCDMDSAEGRARFAAQARPLWQLLPEGTLGRQLLGEIAERVRIGTHELAQLWGLRRTDSQNYQNKSNQPKRDMRERPQTPLKSFPSPSAGRMRRPAASRASRALQILLTDAGSWETLSQHEQALLCDLPEPHGALFTWLAGQVLDHGAQPWAALRAGLREHAHEAFAVAQIEGVPDNIAAEPEELRGIVAAEARDLVKRQMNAALAEGDMPRYQQLLRQLAQLDPGSRFARGEA